MKILVKPSDIIKRLVWDKFSYYCLDGKSADEINKIIEDDLEFEISEKDAFVCNLISVLYTDEVIYKFQQSMAETLYHKSFKFAEKSYINKQILLNSATKFKNKFPKNWLCDDPNFAFELSHLDRYIFNFIKSIENLETVKINEYPCLKIAQVKKVINRTTDSVEDEEDLELETED